MTTIYQAATILTMNPDRPRATHIAVRDGHILAVGAGEDMPDGGMIDRQFADKVLMPGFVEGHSHIMEGLFWDYHYVGYYDREGPDGTIWPGLKSIDAVVARLKEIIATRPAAEADAPLIAWGFDPIFFTGRRMNIADLDSVSPDTPIIVLHASLHILNTNSPVIEAAGVKKTTIAKPFAAMKMAIHRASFSASSACIWPCAPPGLICWPLPAPAAALKISPMSPAKPASPPPRIWPIPCLMRRLKCWWKRLIAMIFPCVWWLPCKAAGRKRHRALRACTNWQNIKATSCACRW